MTVLIGEVMHKIPARWLSPDDGVRTGAKLWFEDGSVYVENDRGARRYAPVNKVELSARMPGLPRRITFDDGVVVVVDDNDYIDSAVGGRGVLYKMEAHWRGILSSVIAAVFVVWGFGVYVLPVATKIIAAGVSQASLQTLSEEAYEQLLDGNFLAPSKLPPLDRSRLEALFLQTADNFYDGDDEKNDGDGFRYQLRFHQMAFGKTDIANAFAFPDGMVVASDGLVALLNDKELEAVFVHELSHVRHRHGLRAVMQSSAVFVISSFLLGDISFVLSGGAALLVQQKFSRDFEREADCDAYLYLHSRGESPEAMASALNKLEDEFNRAYYDDTTVRTDGKPVELTDDEDESTGKDEGGESAGQKALRVAWEMLSTHPATHERVDFREHCDGY